MHLAGFVLSPVPTTSTKTLFGNVEGNNAATVGRWQQLEESLPLVALWAWAECFFPAEYA